MSKMKLAIIALVPATLLCVPAHALTITNQDKEVRTVTVKSGVEWSDYEIRAGGTIKENCNDNCELTVAGVNEMVLAKDPDKFIIKKGKLHRKNM